MCSASREMHEIPDSDACSSPPHFHSPNNCRLRFLFPNVMICMFGKRRRSLFYHHFRSEFFMETVELKVEMVGIHEKRLRKCLSKLKGIEKVEVDVSSQKVMVTGYVHRNKILKAIRRGGLKADFWSTQNELLCVYASASYGSLRFNNFNFF
ncbi:hypothetical protein OIU77_020358 [Salix suchowensis]|uniref:HMA domain-containing protein n=1 Tax=Salix suchowensis TaxID=1278906 RepID=A0ABQ9CJD4_9ROSI|nr:hypothetical protein OIU77_020358 [Salix suchowensis]